MERDEYKTKDIGEASALLASGIRNFRLEKANGFFWFVFNNKNALKISDLYWSGELKVYAKNYNESFNTLKQRIFSRQIGGKI